MIGEKEKLLLYVTVWWSVNPVMRDSLLVHLILVFVCVCFCFSVFILMWPHESVGSTDGDAESDHAHEVREVDMLQGKKQIAQWGIWCQRELMYRHTGEGWVTFNTERPANQPCTMSNFIVKGRRGRREFWGGGWERVNHPITASFTDIVQNANTFYQLARRLIVLVMWNRCV